MPTWLSVLLAIVGGSGLFGLITMAIWNWQKRGIEKIKAYDEKAHEESMRKIIREEDSELRKDIQEIKHNLSLNCEGTVTSLRNDMKNSLDACREKGFATASDKANWHELYNCYKKMGGNHFREYVDQWKEEMESFPLNKGE